MAHTFITMEKVTLRKARVSDPNQLQTLFVDTIRTTCNGDYDSEQIKVWTSSIENKDRWIGLLKEQYFILAELEGQIVGFGSLLERYCLDFLYVHKTTSDRVLQA